MQVGDTIKIKNPQLNFQKELRYVVTKVNKTTLHCYLKDNVSVAYKGIKKSLMVKV